MGYPTPLVAFNRLLFPSTLISSTRFTRFDKFNFGNRMALIQIPNTQDVVVWNSLPMGEEFDKALEILSKDSKLNLYAAIIPDKEHTMAAEGLKKKHPDILLIGPSGITDKPNLKLDHTFEDSQANKVIPGASVDPKLDNFDFVFFNGHANREVVVVDKTTRTAFEADLLFNIPSNGKNFDQYGEDNQNGNFWGFLTSRLNPESSTGRFLHQRLLKKTPESIQGLKALLSLDFDNVVMSHGEIIQGDGKAAFKKMFKSYL